MATDIRLKEALPEITEALVATYTECGRTPGYPHGHDDIHLVKLLG